MCWKDFLMFPENNGSQNVKTFSLKWIFFYRRNKWTIIYAGRNELNCNNTLNSSLKKSWTIYEYEKQGGDPSIFKRNRKQLLH